MKNKYVSPEFDYVKIALVDALNTSPFNPIGGEIGESGGDESGPSGDDW